MSLPQDAPRLTRVAGVLWPTAVALATILLSLVPLLGSSDFYMRSDTTVQFAPTWFHLGELTRAGAWPPTLDPDAWSGGNYAAEGLFGVYNPVNLVIWLAVSLAGSLWAAVLLVKIATLVALAVGCYFLFREYGAAPWAAGVVAVALPWAGFSHYFDAAAFPAGLIAFAYAPWTWWAFRRTMRGSLNPFWAFLIGALAVTQGNPYGTLAVVVTGLGVVCEGFVTRHRPGVARLAITGGCVAALLPLVYLPLIETAHVAVRSERPLLSDTGRLSPTPWDLLVSGHPGYVPDMVCGRVTDCETPAVYLCWFVVALLPWLDFGAVRRRLREQAALAVIAVFYLAAMLGPSEVWFFRWPIRLSGYFLLALAVPLALMLSRALRADHKVARLLITLSLLLGTVGLGTVLNNAAFEAETIWGGVVLSALVLLLVGPQCWRPWDPRPLAAALLTGTTVVLLWQSLQFPENENLRDWPVATDVQTLQTRFDDLDGRVIQFAELSRFQDEEATTLQGPADESFLPGSMFQVADVQAVNNYSGMGHLLFHRFLCMHYEGSTDACGFERFWTPLTSDGVPLADLMKLDTVVAESSLTTGFTAPPGWQASARGEAVVYERTRSPQFEGSRLSWVSPGLEVTDARTHDDHHESVQVSGQDAPGQMVFAMLEWPGYSAELDGRPLEVGHNDAGLLMVEIPPGAAGELHVRYSPPGLTLSLWCAGLGGAVAAALGVWTRLRKPRATSAV